MNETPKSEKFRLTRRGLLKTLGLGTLTLLGMKFGRKAQAMDPEGESTHKWIMVIDQAKCTGCGYCTLACQAHNDTPPHIHWNRVMHVDKIGTKDVYLSRPCMHCDHAPCVGVCPVKASYKRADGIVMMDYDRCIGCRYCEVACPYGARSFNWEAFEGENPAVPEWGTPEVPRRPRGVVEKCTFCFHRIERGLKVNLTPGKAVDATPACVIACPVGARIFGDQADPESMVNTLIKNNPYFRLREDMGVDPRVYYLSAQREL